MLTGMLTRLHKHTRYLLHTLNLDRLSQNCNISFYPKLWQVLVTTVVQECTSRCVLRPTANPVPVTAVGCCPCPHTATWQGSTPTCYSSFYYENFHFILYKTSHTLTSVHNTRGQVLSLANSFQGNGGTILRYLLFQGSGSDRFWSHHRGCLRSVLPVSISCPAPPARKALCALTTFLYLWSQRLESSRLCGFPDVKQHGGTHRRLPNPNDAHRAFLLHDLMDIKQGQRLACGLPSLSLVPRALSCPRGLMPDEL